MTKSAIQSGASTVREHDRRQWILLLILSLPSIYVLLTLPPLWRDSDGFNEVASTFAPKGIIHWLPGYCLGARLILLGAGITGSLLEGHGMPYLSISITPLNDVGVYTLIVVQHLLPHFLSVLRSDYAQRPLFTEGCIFCILSTHSVDIYLCELRWKRSIQQPAGVPDLDLRLEVPACERIYQKEGAPLFCTTRWRSFDATNQRSASVSPATGTVAADTRGVTSSTDALAKLRSAFPIL